MTPARLLSVQRIGSVLKKSLQYNIALNTDAIDSFLIRAASNNF